jgi:carboxylesterase type B
MLVDGGNTGGLYRGAIMLSGAPFSVGDVTEGQADYDLFVKRAGCASSKDTLGCLRRVPLATFQAAADQSLSIFAGDKVRQRSYFVLSMRMIYVFHRG